MADGELIGQDAAAFDPDTAASAELRRRHSPIVRRNVRIAAVVAIVALVLLVVLLVRYETRGKYFENTNDAFVQADAVTVSPKISGYVQRVFVSDNEDVRAGTPLVLVDARDYRAQAAQSQAQVDVARANADNARAAILEQQATIDQARAELATARTDAGFAAGEVDRYAPLATTGAETGEKLADLRNRAAQATGTVAVRRAALEAAERSVAALRAQVRQALAQGEAAQAQVSTANVNVGSTIVRASVDGRIGDRSVRVGQFVQAGTRMMSVVPLGAIYVNANFKETQIGLMRAGQPATIHVDALSGVDLRGHVDSLAPGTGAQFSLLPPQNATGNFTKIVQRVPVRIAIDAGADARRVLVPGLSATVTIDTISAKGAYRRIADQERTRDRAGD